MSATVGYVQDEGLNFEALVILDDSGDVLEIQRSLGVDDQDAALHMDTYCIVRGGLTHYGGVLSWGLSHDLLVVKLDLEAAEALQLPQELVVAVSPDGSQMILQYMERLLGVIRSDKP